VSFLINECICLLTLTDLPFAYLSYPIPANPTPRALHDAYIALYKSACDMAQKTSTPSTTKQSAISYNLGFTDRIMVLCPRNCEGKAIRNSEGQEVGFVGPNGSFLGGTLLVKSEAEWNILRNDEFKLKDILSAIGLPPKKAEYDEKL
jgi:ATP adenylyltransferase